MEGFPEFIEVEDVLKILNVQVDIPFDKYLGYDGNQEVDKFRTFVDCLRLQKTEELESLIEHFYQQDGLVYFVLEQKEVDKKLLNNFIKMHDIWANSAFGLNPLLDYRDIIDVNFVVKKVLHTLLVVHLVMYKKSPARWDFISAAISMAMTNYDPLYPELVQGYVQSIKQLSCIFPKFCDDLKFASHSSTESYLKAVLSHCQSGEDVFQILGGFKDHDNDVHTKLLLTKQSYVRGFHSKHICYLKRAMDEDAFSTIFVKVMSLWADPVIAKSHVTQEVIHYSTLVFHMFIHLGPTSARKCQEKITHQLAKGLPNHFNSADFRTVNLAKFLCELLTESMRKDLDSRTEFKVDEYEDDDLCRKLINSFTACCAFAEKFWLAERFNKLVVASKKPILRQVKQQETNVTVEDSDDSDDDDDLEPIESNEVDFHPDIKIKINYVRDYLDNVGDIKTYDEMEYAMKRLPFLIERQLKFDHVNLAKEIMDSVFVWENEYQQPILDQFRRQSLCSILKATDKIEVPEHFCRLFHRQGSQPYKKNLILDVMSSVSKEIPLKQLIGMSKCAFNIILRDDMSIQSQDVTVKIPMVLFFSRLIANTLPKQCVEESMVISYLNSLKELHLTSGDSNCAAIEQSVKYAVHNLTDVLAYLQTNHQSVAMENLQTSIADTKSWLVKLQRTNLDTL